MIIHAIVVAVADKHCFADLIVGITYSQPRVFNKTVFLIMSYMLNVTFFPLDICYVIFA